MIKKILTLTLSLFMAFSLCLTISANSGDDANSTAEATISNKDGSNEYTSFLEAFKALKAGDTLKLERNVTVTLNDTSNGGSDGKGADNSLWSEIPNVTLDLNDYTLTTISNYGGSFNVLNVLADGWIIKNGSLIVKLKDGTADSYALAAECEDAKLTIDNVSLSGGVAVYDSVTVTMKDTNMGTTEVAATNYYCGYAESGAKFVIDGGTYTSNGTSPVFYAADGSSIEIIKGNFIGSIFGKRENGTGTISISGGIFTDDVTKYLATDKTYNAVKNSEGKYVVVEEGAKVEVKKDVATTPALEETAYNETKSAVETLNQSLSDDQKITFNETTKVELKSNVITETSSEYPNVPTFTKEQEEKVEEKVVESVSKEVSSTVDTNNIELIPLDITLNVVNTNQDGTTKEDKITTILTNPITVTLYLNDNTLSKLEGKIVKVIRIHKNSDGNEEITVLDATLTNNALSFKTNKFSTYVIAYGDYIPTKTYSYKDKNQDGIVDCSEEMNNANWIWSESKGACVYKVSNTGTK